FGVRMLGAALVVIFDFQAMSSEDSLGFRSRKSVTSGMTTKAAPSIRTPKAAAVSMVDCHQL
ncbi:MAG TPA: hypothetical protein VFY40_29205, partial [Blastocatellia bacterium]|nr:hypothetical protein [Blastocatellia bacterium]